ncbi:single-stranded DNA-binding protein [Brachybacterium tyrofermentans]|uniref:single-stranded DNA-binding protein n=1 Tax=Brachybacterium tyrofermentans TaxID=47848 RepID=UPI003FD3998E
MATSISLGADTIRRGGLEADGHVSGVGIWVVTKGAVMSVTQKMESQRGRIGKEIKHGLDKNGKPWVNFSLAVDRNARNEQGNWEKVGTDWYQVSAFRELAKNVKDSFSPGDPVVVSGDLSQSVRVVEGPDGAPVAQTRDEVRARMIGPDMILTPVIMPESPGSSGPRQASGPDPQAAEGFTPGIDEEVFAARRSASLRAPEAASPMASAPDGAGSIWPQTTQPGTGGAGVR